MATTMTSLAGKLFAEEMLVAAVKGVVPISKFAHRYTEAERSEGGEITVPVFAVGTAQTFAGDYTKNAGTADGVPIPLNKHFFDPKVYTDEDFQKCPVAFWKGAGRAVGKSISRSIAAEVCGLINKTNIPKSDANEKVLAVSSLTKKTLAALTETAEAADFNPAEATLLCSGDLFTTILSLMDANVYGGPEAVRKGSLAEGCYGFGNIMRCNALTTASGENLVGAIVHNDALGYAGAPLMPQSRQVLEEHGLATDEPSGLTIGIRRFGVNTSGKNYIIGEVLMGSKVLQPTKIVRLVSTATA